MAYAQIQLTAGCVETVRNITQRQYNMIAMILNTPPKPDILPVPLMMRYERMLRVIGSEWGFDRDQAIAFLDDPDKWIGVESVSL